MEHSILTKEEEFKYGTQVVHAKELRIKIDGLLEERRWERRLGMELFENNNEEELENNNMGLEEMGDVEDGNHPLLNGYTDDVNGKDENALLQEGMNEIDLDYEFLSYELEYLSLYGFKPSWMNDGIFGTEVVNKNGMEGGDDTLPQSSSTSAASSASASPPSIDKHYDNEHAEHMLQHISQLRNHQSNYINFARKNGVAAETTGSASPSNSAATNSYTPLLHLPLHLLTEQDIITTLSIPGGKKEVIQILLDGAYAREMLMRRNVKLVMSIAKTWAKNSFSTKNANLGGVGGIGGGGTGGGHGNKGAKKYLSLMYEGSWDRPSLDEAMQEGMLGLARAVDKYDPERGLRFSTYATHWITSYVRVCFQRAVTGCLRVPSQLHDIKVGHDDDDDDLCDCVKRILAILLFSNSDESSIALP